MIKAVDVLRKPKGSFTVCQILGLLAEGKNLRVCVFVWGFFF